LTPMGAIQNFVFCLFKKVWVEHRGLG
jgi:hypothetical protein